MKRLLLVGLTTLLLTAASALTVNAQTRYLEPFDLVTLAYQGSFRGQDIPGYGRFLRLAYQRQITAEDIVDAAVRANRLPAGAEDDENYVRSVNQQLNAMLRTLSPNNR